jgi:ubiquinone/menaquinone biosynthesis C-methylase UbiE
MTSSSGDRARVFYDTIAANYDALLDTTEARQHRDCFWRLAAALLPPNARVLDFGAGTGVDAAHLAASGHTVTAYDVSPGMMAVLRERCAAQIGGGSIQTVVGSLEDLRAAIGPAAVFDAVLSNFAVLSLIRDLHPVLRFFGTIVRPGGRLILSIQNPWFSGDMKTRAFWDALWTLTRRGVMRYRSAETGDMWRHLPTQVRRVARPEFRGIAVPAQPMSQCRGSFGVMGVFRLLAFERR